MDFISDFAFPLPAIVITILLGAPTEDAQQIKQFASKIDDDYRVHMVIDNLPSATKYVDETDPQNFVKAADDKTRAFFCETCSNPACEVVDLKAVADLAHENGVPLIVDATFSTPYLTKPISYGADIVIHSLTKWLGGHGIGLGGIVIDAGTFKWGAGKHPLYTQPDTSYGGLRWGLDLPEMLAPLAFILRMRTVPLRRYMLQGEEKDPAYIALVGKAGGDGAFRGESLGDGTLTITDAVPGTDRRRFGASIRVPLVPAVS